MIYYYSFLYSSWFWLALTVFFVIVELCTAFTLTTIWFAISAAIMILVSKTGLPFLVQVILFVIIAFALLIFTRPFAIKKLKIGKEKTNIDALAGITTIALKEISEFQKGEVKINGLIWSAKSDDAETIPVGTKCVVVKIEGSHAVVKKV
jgi:membrane protein implicated in regulation of membrane protease activity